MLTSLRFENYRCFNNHELLLKPETIIVGKNNAGKSTIVEGLRLIATITSRYKKLPFKAIPAWSSLAALERGIRASHSGQNIDWQNIFHQYQDPPATITARFDSGYRIELHVGPDGETHAVILTDRNSVISTRQKAIEANLPLISILPQITPLQKEEKFLNSDYVKANISSHLASQHFRNQLYLYRDFFDDFVELAERSWPRLKIEPLEGKSIYSSELPRLLVRDGDFVAEVGWMGHGLQMWLQIMWFVARSKDSKIIILDEPDVYMHPDLQRKLLRLVRNRNQQCIIATHSTEILAETEPNNILVIERSQQRSSYATDLPAVQKVLNEIGSAQNLHLTRLLNAKKIILVEGKDMKFLKRFQDLIFPESKIPIDSVPNMPIGGWAKWPIVLGSALFLKNTLNEDIKAYCILDSDYHTQDQIQQRKQDAFDKNINLHIWRKKEIENYLIVPEAIKRIIFERCDSEGPSLSDIDNKLLAISDELKNKTTDCISQELKNENPRLDITTTNRAARNIISNSWDSLPSRLSIISGKDILSILSRWSSEAYGVSFSPYAILREIKRNELDQEIIDVITAIENLSSMPLCG